MSTSLIKNIQIAATNTAGNWPDIVPNIWFCFHEQDWKHPEASSQISILLQNTPQENVPQLRQKSSFNVTNLARKCHEVLYHKYLVLSTISRFVTTNTTKHVPDTLSQKSGSVSTTSWKTSWHLVKNVQFLLPNERDGWGDDCVSTWVRSSPSSSVILSQPLALIPNRP